MTDIEWIKEASARESHKQQPDLQGWVTISKNGKEHASSDKKSGQLADVLLHFNDITDEIGRAFGQKKVEEIHIVCEEQTVICLPGEKETFAAIFEKGTRPNEFLARYRTK